MELSRRGLLKFAIKAPLALAAAKLGFSADDAAAAKRIQSAERAEDIWRSIEDLEKKLAPGGSFARKLGDPNTDPGQVDWIFRYIQAVQEKMELVNFFGEHSDIDPRALRRAAPPLAHFHGMKPRDFSLREKASDGRKRTRRCMGYYLSFGGDENFYVTNRHCVEGTTEEGSFVTLGDAGEDIAVMYEPGYRGPALMMDREMTDRDLEGRMMVMRSLDRNNTDTWRISFLIKMNPVLYEKIFKQRPRGLGTAFADSFVFIMRGGDSTPDRAGMIPPQGQSGSPILVWFGTPESGGYRVALTFFGARVLGADCIENGRGMCAPLGSAVGIDALKALCASAKEGRQTKANPRGGGFVTRIIKH